MSGLERFNTLDQIRMAEAVFQALHRRIGKRKKMKGREGGYLCITDLYGLPILITAIGVMPKELRQRFFNNAREKAARLALLAQFAGHVLSRESRNETLEHWIGAVLGRTIIISFSGLPEDADECYTVLLSVASGELPARTAHRLLRKNSYYKDVRSLIDGFRPRKR